MDFTALESSNCTDSALIILDDISRWGIHQQILEPTSWLAHVAADPSLTAKFPALEPNWGAYQC